MPTKHRAIRLTDEDWQKLVLIFAEIVPDDRKPAHTRNDANWKAVEGLRMIANGDLMILLPDIHVPDATPTATRDKQTSLVMKGDVIERMIAE